jgi:hypothetical protein
LSVFCHAEVKVSQRYFRQLCIVTFLLYAANSCLIHTLEGHPAR